MTGGRSQNHEAVTVLVTDYAWPGLEIEERVLGAVDGATVVAAKTGEESELVALAPGADAILTCWQKVTPAVLRAAPRCRIVSRYGIGLDNIAVDVATELGMLVTNVPDFCLDEVSDHALALLLASARRIVGFARMTRAGEWNSRAGRTLPRLRGQTLGLIGYGAIGRTLAPKAAALGLKVIAYTPRIAPDALAPFGAATNDLAEVLRTADYISIHAPLTAETRGLIGERELRLMKPTATLINTARGPIVDETALVRALTEGWIGGAAIDVLGQEPPDPSHPLLALENVIATPHVAFASESAVADLRTRAAEHVAQVLRGELPTNLVNPEVLTRPNCRVSPA
ncbi:MAG: D-3-phosphoglycerate dehydrogenase / 2-oxoglutarate reductase [Thermomicrobiales bacterium]|nr:D-3-phosphoglycerate dehydrogenase / 2-oxoglutarate reductase [Thermomicrobiales bacterium]